MTLKIGIIKSLNARPLTYGLEQNHNIEIISDTPAILVEKLLQKKLAAALISSVECLRHPDLDYISDIGVCSKEKVKSILFFKNKKTQFPPDKIYVDSGSRSSVALIQLLFKIEYGIDIQTVATNPEEIMAMIISGENNHMLFGDNALIVKWDTMNFSTIDLSRWWKKLTGYPFCFAFWAFPKEKPLKKEIFIQSLESGLKNINIIIANENKFSKEFKEEYLTKDLHYYTDEEDLKGFEFFKNKCKEYGIISI